MLTSILGDHKQRIMRCRWLGVPSNQTYHLWMKGLSPDREDNIFFHMFSLQKKNLIETGKSKQKQKNKHYGFFFISHCHPVRSSTTREDREGKIPKIKTEKAPQTNLPRKKTRIQIIKPYHPKPTLLLLLPFFWGGIGQKSCLSKVGKQLTSLPGTQPRDGSGGASQ